jgi:hypothetical protein
MEEAIAAAINGKEHCDKIVTEPSQKDRNRYNRLE